MAWYTLRRLIQLVPVFLGATLLIYAIVFLLPGDPIAALGGDRGLPPAAEAALRARYHLDDPFFVQYFKYLGGIVQGDFGISFSGQPVADLIARAFPVTLRLTAMTLVIEAVL